jgi:hypothetical protein
MQNELTLTQKSPSTQPELGLAGPQNTAQAPNRDQALQAEVACLDNPALSKEQLRCLYAKIAKIIPSGQSEAQHKTLNQALNPSPKPEPSNGGGLAAMQSRVDAAKADSIGVRPGGVKVSLGGLETKVALGTGSPTANTSTALSQQKNSASVAGKNVIGEPCKNEEISVGAGSWKWMKQKFEKLGRVGDSNANLAVTGPSVSADVMCVDPAQVVKNASAVAVDGVINSPVGLNAAKLGTKSGDALKAMGE